MKAAVQEPPQAVGLPLANWNWKLVRQFIHQRFGRWLSRSSCLNYLHRLGFTFKPPKKRFGKADPAQRKAFVAAYAQLWEEVQRARAKIWFADEAHFRADGDLRGKWVLRGQPALVDSSSPRWGEKASYYSAVCLETGEVAVIELAGNSTAQTSVSFLGQRTSPPWRGHPPISGDPGVAVATDQPAPVYSGLQRGRSHLEVGRAEVRANTCLGCKAQLQEKLGAFFCSLAARRDEVKRRCRTVLQAKAAALGCSVPIPLDPMTHLDLTFALV